MDAKELQRVLDDGNIDVNMQDENGNTPLMSALLKPKVSDDIIRAFLNCGARIDIKNNEGQTAVDILQKRGGQLIFELPSDTIIQQDILKKNAPGDLLKYVAHTAMPKIEKIIALANNGATVNNPNYVSAIGDYNGWGPIHWLADKGHTEGVQFVIDNGANINYKATDDRKTPLHIASEKGHFEIVAILLKEGADISLKDNKNLTPLHSACWNALKNSDRYNDFLDTIKLLINSGIGINAQTKGKYTALDLLEYTFEKEKKPVPERQLNFFENVKAVIQKAIKKQQEHTSRADVTALYR